MAEAEKWLQVLIDRDEYGYAMSHRAFVLCDSLKRMWRRAHPNITALWSTINDAVITAIHNPGQTFAAGMLAARRDGSWLRIRLPSGRYLCYPGVRMRDDSVQYRGKNQYTRKWEYLTTYGGKLFENICQAAARDIMAENMHAIDDAGYNIVLTVHDEIISEAPDTAAYSHDKLSEMLAHPPTWASDMPLAAGGFETYRYKKD
jgi:DNA polymerase